MAEQAFKGNVDKKPHKPADSQPGSKCCNLCIPFPRVKREPRPAYIAGLARQDTRGAHGFRPAAGAGAGAGANKCQVAK